MQRLIGMWVWPCLLRRRLLSVLEEVYDIENLTDRQTIRRPLTSIQRVEPHMLIELIQILGADLRAKTSKRIYESNKNMTGEDVVCTDQEEVDGIPCFVWIAEKRARKGW